MSSQGNLPFGDQPLTRMEWQNACEFHDLTEAEVLREVSRRVSELKARAGTVKQAHPLVLLDLDSTLYEVGTRTHQILREWLESSESAQHPRVRDAMARLEYEHVGYSVNDTLTALGVELKSEDDRAALKAIKKFWAERFFTSRYLAYDRAYPGAAHFTRELHGLGAEIVYLTGRDEPGMGDGTRANLVRDGFPWETDRTHLLMKAAFHLPDLDHKRAAADYIRRHGTLVASFENEPPNLIALSDLFPEAMHVFVDTVCSDHGALPRKGLYRIKGFTI